jgi:hypothetical protein
MNASVSMLFYSIISAFSIIYTTYSIKKIISQRKKREYFLFMQLNNKFNFAWIYLIFVIIWIGILTKDISSMHRILKGEYLSSIFQLFNPKFVESLSIYFYENDKTIEYYETLRYPNDFMNSLYMIITSICLLILDVYREKVKIALFQDGVLVKDKFYKKDKLLQYEWGGAYENTMFFKGIYCNLVFKMDSIFQSNRELAVRVNYSDKDKIDNILKYTYNLNSKDNNGEI